MFEPLELGGVPYQEDTCMNLEPKNMKPKSELNPQMSNCTGIYRCMEGHWDLHGRWHGLVVRVSDSCASDPGLIPRRATSRPYLLPLHRPPSTARYPMLTFEPDLPPG